MEIANKKGANYANWQWITGLVTIRGLGASDGTALFDPCPGFSPLPRSSTYSWLIVHCLQSDLGSASSQESKPKFCQLLGRKPSWSS